MQWEQLTRKTKVRKNFRIMINHTFSDTLDMKGDLIKTLGL